MNSLIPKIDIRPDHWEIVRDILHKHVPDYEVWAFGSRAKWTAKQYSDLDLAVITDKPLSLEVSADLSDDFSESDLPWKVDIVDWATTQDAFREIIKRDKVVVQKAKGWGVSADWPIVRLGDYIDSSLGKMLDQKKNKGNPHPYLGNSNVRWGYFDLSDLSEMRFEDSEHDRYGIKKGDLIVCEGGEPGRCAIWNEDVPNMKIQKALHRIRTLPGLNSEYLYLCFLHWGKTKKLDPYFTGTTIKHLTGKAVAEIPLALPPENYQLSCAKIVMGLERKIKLNTQTNQTLESIAQAIFKSWFVDFDPVKAKIAVLAESGTREQAELAAMGVISGKGETELAQLQQQNPEHYQQLTETAALFPSAMVESELEEIPEGWEVKTLSEMINIIGGGTPNRSIEEYWNGDIPWFSIKDLPNPSDVFVIDTDEKITELGLKKSSTKLLPANTTIITARGTVGKLALIDKPMCMNQSCYGITGANGIEPIFNYFNLKEAISTLQRNTHGAVFDTITTKTFDSYSSAFCGNSLARTFDQTTRPLLEKIKCNLYQIKYLAELRDSLLPKLLSGEIDLTNLQSEVA